jgi:hypothetical protein
MPYTLVPMLVASAVLALAATGCDSGVNYNPLSRPTPTVPVAVAVPASLTFSGTGGTQTLTLSATDYVGSYTVSGCAGIVTVVNQSQTVFAVTAVAGGTCTLAVSGSNISGTTVPVTVTTVSVPVQ